MEKRTAELNQRVEEVERLKRVAVEAAAGLRAANEELESFSYSVSHDLLAPLRAIDGFTRTIEEEYGKEIGEEGLAQTNRVRSAVNRMGLLIEDLLRHSRIGRKRIELE